MPEQNTENTERSGRKASALSAVLACFPPTIDEAIERAAQHLPDGYVVNIQIEHHGYNVELVKPDFSTIDNVDGGDGMRSDINEAICIANGFTG